MTVLAYQQGRGLRKVLGVRRPGLIVLLAMASLFSGCGESKPAAAGAKEAATSPTAVARDERATDIDVERAIADIVTSPPSRPQCEQRLSTRFLRETYGSRNGCERYARAAPDGTPAEALAPRVLVPSIDLAGSTARVRVVLDGGAASGATGHMQLALVSGRWRVDHYEDDLLRSRYERFMFRQIKLTASRPGLDESVTARCVDKRFSALGSKRLRALATALARDQKPVDGSFLINAISGCLSAPGSGPGTDSYFRFHLVREIVTQIPQLADEIGKVPNTRTEACLRRRLATLTDAEVLEHVNRNKNAPPPATARIGELTSSCFP